MSPLPIIAAALAIGVLAGSAGDRPWAVVISLALVAVGAARWRMVVPARALALVLAAFVAGLVRAAEIRVAVPRQRATREQTVVRGRVTEGCVPDASAARCTVVRDDGTRVALRVPYETCAARPGDTIVANAVVRSLAPDANGARLGPGGSLWRRGFDASAVASGCARSDTRIRLMEHARRAGLGTRALLGRGLDAALPPIAARQARALLFGDNAQLDPSDVDAFRDSGLAHLLAVSGAHVALLAALLGGILNALLRRIPAIAARGWVAMVSVAVPLPALAVFVLATGESASAVRALIGAVLAALATIDGRKARGESVVAASVIVTLTAMPGLIFDAGWQLSVVAAWGLAAGPRETVSEEGEPVFWRSLLGVWREALVASARVAVVAAPVLAWHFQRAPLTAVVANAIAAPLAEAAALPLVLATGLLASVSVTLAQWLGIVVAPILMTLFAMPHVAMSLPFAATSLPPPTPPEAVVLVAVAIAFVRAGWRVRIVGAAIAAVLLIGLEARHRQRVRPTGVVRVTAIDVGQGDAILVDLPDGTAMLIDAGGDRPEAPDPGARVVVPFLADRRRRSLVAVVASHPHPDHIGGLPALLRWADVGELWDTRQGEGYVGDGAYGRMRAAARERGIAVRGPESLCGPPRAFHGAMLEVIAPCPVALAGTAPNDASFVLRLTFDRASALFPGDLERGGEARIHDAMHAVTLLKVGHHGSRTSSTTRFLDAVRPRVALVSAGHPSQFSHPHADVVERFGARGIPLYSTSEYGAVSVTLHGDGSHEAAFGSALP